MTHLIIETPLILEIIGLLNLNLPLLIFSVASRVAWHYFTQISEVLLF